MRTCNVLLDAPIHCILLLVMVVTITSAQTTCSFNGCDCSLGNACVFDSYMLLDQPHHVTGGSLILGSSTQLDVVIPNGRLHVPDGAIVLDGVVNVTTVQVVVNYPLLKSIALVNDFQTTITNTFPQCTLNTLVDANSGQYNISVFCQAQEESTTWMENNGNGKKTHACITEILFMLLIVLIWF